MAKTVNEALGPSLVFDGELTEVEGRLAWSPEVQSLDHAVAWELGERSSIWLVVDDKTPDLDAVLLTEFAGKLVSITGVIRSPEPKLGGSGQFSMWPADMLVRSVRRVGSRQELQ